MTTEAMVALVVFALAGLAVVQATLQQNLKQLGRMEEKIGCLRRIISWQLRLENAGPR